MSILLYFLTSSQLDRPIINPIALPLCHHQVAHPFLPLLQCDCVFSVDCCMLFVISHPWRPHLNYFCLNHHPKWCEIVSPYTLPWSNLIVTPPHIADTVFWLVCVCLFIVWWLYTHSHSHGVYFLFHFLLLKLPSKTMGNCPPQTFWGGRIAGQIHLSMPNVGADVFCWLLCCFGWWWPLILWHSSSLYFFVAPFASPDDRKQSWYVQPWLLLITNTPFPPLQPTFGWLLCLLTKRWPPKTCTLPSLHFWRAPLGHPDQGILLQRAQVQGNCSRIIGIHGDMIRVHGWYLED